MPRSIERVPLTAEHIVSLLPVGDGITHEVPTIRQKGTQVLVSFPNGYGASIIDHEYSYDLEMAVLHPARLCYATPVTSDVLGYLTEDELRDALLTVMSLPENPTCDHASAWTAEVSA